MWPALHGAERGYTEDTATNLMLAFDRHSEPKQVRFDRVIVHSARWRPASIQVIGREPLGNGMLKCRHHPPSTLASFIKPRSMHIAV